MKYLPTLDRVEVLRRSGFVLILEKVALNRAMDREFIGQREQKKATIEFSSNWAAHSSYSSCGGNRLESRERERRKTGELHYARAISHRFGEIAETYCWW